MPEKPGVSEGKGWFQKLRSRKIVIGIADFGVNHCFSIAKLSNIFTSNELGMNQ